MREAIAAYLCPPKKAVHQCTKDMRYTVYIALKFIELTLNLQYIRETSTLSSVYIVFSCPAQKKSRTILLQIK